MKDSNSVFLYVYPKEHPLPADLRIRDCAADFAAKAGITFSEGVPILRTERGKPYFLGAALSFSITHSGDFWICAMGKNAVGVDLQDERSCKKESITRRFFHPAEQQFLRKANWQPFFLVWAAKESYVKLTGEGITGQFPHFSVVDKEGRITGVGSKQIRFVPFQKGYVLCVCGENISDVFLIYR